VRRLGESFLRGLGGALVALVGVLLFTQDLTRAIGFSVAAFPIFFIMGLFTGKWAWGSPAAHGEKSSETLSHDSNKSKEEIRSQREEMWLQKAAGNTKKPTTSTDSSSLQDLNRGQLAKPWYVGDAEQGSANAQLILGKRYDEGLGVPQNFSEAYVWFSLAAASGDETAIKSRDIAASRLSIDALNTAQQRATQLFEGIQQRKSGE